MDEAKMGLRQMDHTELISQQQLSLLSVAYFTFNLISF